MTFCLVLLLDGTAACNNFLCFNFFMLIEKRKKILFFLLSELSMLNCLFRVAKGIYTSLLSDIPKGTQLFLFVLLLGIRLAKPLRSFTFKNKEEAEAQETFTIKPGFIALGCDAFPGVSGFHLQLLHHGA